MGFVYKGSYAEGQFLFDTNLVGNSAKGHSGEAYGTELSDDEKCELIEYLKTF